jgi:tripartite ATP-independent transporter DctM subunit
MILLLLMLGLLLMKMPVAFALGLTSVLGLLHRGIPLELVPQRMFTAVNSFTLLAVPLFIFVGEVMNTGGVTRRLFNFCLVLVRHVTGSLGHVNVLASVIFAGMSGSAVADANGLGIIEIKAMREAGFDDDFSAAITATSSTIGPIIPPSIPLVIYAVLSEQSVGRLFIGGIIPGLLMGLALMVVIYFYSIKRGYPAQPCAKWDEIRRSTVEALPCLLTPAIILFGIMSGFVSTTEAAALAAFWALFLSFGLYREATLEEFRGILHRSIIGSVSTLIIIAGANILTWIVIHADAAPKLSAAILGLTHNPTVLLLLINVLLLIMGCFLESISILMIMTPILLPVVPARA